MPGILFSNLPLPGLRGGEAGGARIVDVAPTVLSLLGVGVPAGLDGTDLTSPPR